MKRRNVIRETEQLYKRERYIWSRFLEPYAAISGWDASSLDMAASYVGLLHADTEKLLEDSVRFVLEHAVRCADAGYPHPVLLNALTFYQGQISASLGKGVKLVPPRAQLRRDPRAAAAVWRDFGASGYWEGLVAGNHGADMKYLERLFQPLGLDLSTGTFTRMCESRGVQRLAKTPPGLGTELREFVNLRGRAVHTSSGDFLALVRSMRPVDVRQSGQRAATAVVGIIHLVSRRLW